MSEEQVRTAFHQQAKSCEMLGSPFTARLCRLSAMRLDASSTVGACLLGWQGDPAGSADSVPLRFCGALHALVLTRMDRDLEAAYPPGDETDDDRLWAAIALAMSAHELFVLDWLKSAPQTNEVRRSSVLFAGMCVIAAETGLPLRLLEPGASAGLNLIAERYCHRLGNARYGDAQSVLTLAPEWRGSIPPSAAVKVASRNGCDLNPLRLGSETNRLRLKAFVWADQPDRQSRLEAAMKLAAPLVGGDAIAAADVAEWLPAKLAKPSPGIATVVMHSIAWQYFPQQTQRRCGEAIEQAGKDATRQSPLAWLAMEADGGQGAAVTLRLWPSGGMRKLGRADFHGRWIEWAG